MEFGDHPALGGVVLDNLTVQSAFRVLGNDELIQVPHAARRRADKWDYDLNLALRVAIDVECLAQLVHAIVLHEEIGVSPGFARGAAGQAGGQPAIGEGGLGEVVKIMACPLDVQREFLARSAEQALAISRLPDFRRYLKALSSGGFEGVILDISNGYFETGYSDPSALAGFELQRKNASIFPESADSFYFKLAEDELRQAAGLARRARLATEPAELNALLAAQQARAGMAGRLSGVGEQMRSIDYRDHPLAESPIPRGYDHEKMTAAYDLVRNLAAALYFQYLADLSASPYMPHPLRAPLAAFDPERTAIPDVEQRILAHVQALRRNRISAITDTIGPGGFDLNVPLVLARILRDSRAPHEVIPRALELRDSPPAVRLRGWFRDLHALLRTSDADIKSAERELAGFRALISTWSGAPASADTPEITVGVTLGIVSLSGLVRISPKNVRRRWRLQFLYDLARAGDTVTQLGPVLTRALGEPTARAWQRAHDTIDQFTQAQGIPGNRDTLLDLRKE
jgi:hypothetical protein